MHEGFGLACANLIPTDVKVTMIVTSAKSKTQCLVPGVLLILLSILLWFFLLQISNRLGWRCNVCTKVQWQQQVWRRDECRNTQTSCSIRDKNGLDFIFTCDTCTVTDVANLLLVNINQFTLIQSIQAYAKPDLSLFLKIWDGNVIGNDWQ